MSNNNLIEVKNTVIRYQIMKINLFSITTYLFIRTKTILYLITRYLFKKEQALTHVECI